GTLPGGRTGRAQQAENPLRPLPRAAYPYEPRRSSPLLDSGHQHTLEPLHIVQDPAGAADHARQWFLIDMDRQARLMLEELVEVADQRASSGHDDPTVDDIGCELRRRDLQRAPDRIDHLLDRFLD